MKKDKLKKLVKDLFGKKKVQPFSVEEFDSIIQEMSHIHSIKNHDYANGSYLSDLIASRRMGLVPWKNALLRMQQKMSRMESFCKQEEFKVKDESVEDTLVDMAVYSILCLILYRNKK